MTDPQASVEPRHRKRRLTISRPTRRKLLCIVARLQSHVGDALALIDDDRNPDGRKRLRDSLESALALCLRSSAADPPAMPEELQEHGL